MNKKKYQSETDKFRNDLTPFCIGDGLDIGFGGDPIVPSAITIDYPYGSMANCGSHPINIKGDARKLSWFKNNTFDYVYSSHCLEDFENTEEILREWIRVLKRGGKLVLLLPDQKRYEEFCNKVGEIPNGAHKIKNFGMSYLSDIINKIDEVTIIYSKEVENDYNIQIVLEKVKETIGEKPYIPPEYEHYRLFTERVKNLSVYKIIKFLKKVKNKFFLKLY